METLYDNSKDANHTDKKVINKLLISGANRYLN